MNKKRNKYQFILKYTQMSTSFLLVLFVLILFTSCTSLQNRKEKRQEKRDQLCCEKCKYGDDFVYISLRGTYKEGDLDSLFASLELSYSSERKLPYKIPYLVKNNDILYKSMTVQEYNKRLSSPRILENTGDDKLKNKSRILEQLRKNSHISYAGPICCNEHDPIVTVGRILHFTYEGDTNQIEQMKLLKRASIERREGTNHYIATFDEQMGYQIIKIAKKLSRNKYINFVKLLPCIPSPQGLQRSTPLE